MLRGNAVIQEQSWRHINENYKTQRALKILVNRDDESYLLQIFTNLPEIGRRHPPAQG